MKYYTNGITGYVDIHDVVKSMIQLMAGHVKNERYLLVAENLSFKYFFEKVSSHLGVSPPKKEASNFLLQLAWRLDWLNYFFNRKHRKLTKQLMTSISSEKHFNSAKIKSELNFNFTPIDTSIEETSLAFLRDQGF